MTQLTLVLGPGRSGTSLVTRLIAELGVDLGENLLPGNRFNPDGYFEDRAIMGLHKELLSGLGLGEPYGSILPMPEDWQARDEVVAIERRIAAYLTEKLSGRERWAIKDPRISMLLPLWRRIAGEAGIELKFIVSVRHPAAVAASIARASHVAPAIGEAIWLVRVASAIEQLGDDGIIVDYDRVIADPSAEFAKIRSYVLADELAGAPPTPNHTLQDLVKAEYRHAPEAYDLAHDEARAVYASLCEALDGGREERLALASLCEQTMDGLRAASAHNEALRGAMLKSRDHDVLKADLDLVVPIARDASVELYKILRDGSLREALKQADKRIATLQEENERTHRKLADARKARDYHRAELSRLKNSRWMKIGHKLKSLLPGRARMPKDETGGTSRNKANKDLSSPSTASKHGAPPGNAKPGTDSRAASPQLSGAPGAPSAVEPTGSALPAYPDRPGRRGKRSLRLATEASPLLLATRARDVITAGDRPPGHCRVLYLGPIEFKPGVWSTRVEYIFPDLIEPLDLGGHIVFVTGRVPDWALPGAHSLCTRYGVTIHQVASDARMGGLSTGDFWTTVAIAAALQYRPRVMTNIFGGVMFGYANAYAARLVGAKSLMRVAGDEIASRICLGTYAQGSEKHQQDIQFEHDAVTAVDRVITMIDHERERLASYLPEDERDKVVICMRGVDLERFAPVARDRELRKVLFVGRRSAEKGYDLAERVAELAQQRGLPYTFHFAGTFDPGSEGNREYLGFVEAGDLPALYQGHDILINTSITEGLPQSVCEALASGMPCIVPREIFGTYWGSDSGVVTAARDAVAVLEVLHGILTAPERYRALSACARHYAETHLDRRRWQAVYKDTVISLVEA